DALLVLCHWPLSTPADVRAMSFNNRLPDGRVLRRMFADSPARLLYLHGHIHRPWIDAPRGGTMQAATSIKRGAPCLATARYPGGQGFWQIDLPTSARGDLRLVHHVPMPPGDTAAQRQARKCPNPAEAIWEARRVRRGAPGEDITPQSKRR